MQFYWIPITRQQTIKAHYLESSATLLVRTSNFTIISLLSIFCTMS